MLSRITDAVLSPFRTGVLHLLIAASPKREILGFDVVDVTAAPDSSWLLRQVEHALGLIAEISPRQFARAKRDLKRIVLTRAKGAAEYVPAASACFVDTDHVRAASTTFLASSLVHEATHARLWKAGIRYEPAMRERVERRCIQEQQAFLRRIPGSDHLIEQLDKVLQFRWWEPDALLAGRAAQLEKLGTPNWLLRVYRMVTRRNVVSR